ncbi:MAG: hypothetical protein NTX45_16085 [Proteobacteria bacterium]|nr:hypothetical protein [Pseudomonadota bacterium]
MLQLSVIPAWTAGIQIAEPAPAWSAGGCPEPRRPWSLGSAAILIMSQSADKQPVIPAWMPESSHKDVKLGVATKPFSNTYAIDKLPSMALDSGIHAGMTAMEP